MTEIISPHGSKNLIPLYVNETSKKKLKEESKYLEKLYLNSRESSDLLLLSMGAYTPLRGFMNKNDWLSVCTQMKLSNGIFWPIPITISVSEEKANILKIGQNVALVDKETGIVMAKLLISDLYYPELNIECKNIYNTTDLSHPGVKTVFNQEKVYVGGDIQVFNEGKFSEKFGEIYIRPGESRKIFKENGWKNIAALQTRNPMHRSHEYLAKIALEFSDAIFIHHTIGKLKIGDLDPLVSVNATKILIEKYFNSENVLQGGYPIEMRYAGPKEALLHALIRQNFGCTHLIVGRDHAGVGNFYGKFDSQLIFDELWENALLIKPLKFDLAFYCDHCDGMATSKTCNHSEKYKTHISGTDIRNLLNENKTISNKISRPEVINYLKKNI